MHGARSTHFSDPGEFRTSQNWIGGTTLQNASFVPPPIHEMKIALHDFEKFLYDEKSTLPIVQIAFSHAQFETIHPFLDGNGRAGRMLVTLLLLQRRLLENPVLFLSSYFKKHQKIYYAKLNDYHDGDVFSWLDFFLDGVIDTANKSILVSKNIRQLRDDDMLKVQALAKRESESGVLVLSKLYENPIVNTKMIMSWTGFTRAGAQRVIDRFVDLNILKAEDNGKNYDRKYVYKKYLDAFSD
jgi:Fic family protein